MTAKPAVASPPPSHRSQVIEDQASVTDVVVDAMAGAENPRLREVAAAFVRHMHAFAREVRLSEDELGLGIDFLNRIGQASHDAHNEGGDCRRQRPIILTSWRTRNSIQPKALAICRAASRDAGVLREPRPFTGGRASLSNLKGL